MVKGRVSSGSDTSHIKGAGNRVLKNFGPLLRTCSIQIWDGNTWRQGVFLRWSETPRILKEERFQNILFGILTPEEFDLERPNSE